MSSISPNPWQKFCDKWDKGCGYSLCSQAYRIVLSRGKLPSHICFVGEAPGEAEDTTGQPFVGPAGRYLDSMITESVPTSIRVSFCNVVACVPRTQDGSIAEPEFEHMEACQPRLREFLELAHPLIIICVGTKAKDWFEPKAKHSIKLHRPYTWDHDDEGSRKGEKIRVDSILHPAYLLRQNEVNRGLLYRKSCITIRNALDRAKEDGLIYY